VWLVLRRRALAYLLAILMLACAMNGTQVNVRAPATWNTETIQALGNVGYFPSMVVDPDDTLHIAYVDYTDSGLKVAHQNGTGWDIETVEAGILPSYTNLVLDRSYNMHLSYYDRTNEVVKYAVHDGSSWSIEIADTDIYCSNEEMLSMALDAEGVPHLAYCNLPESDNNTLVYANRTDGTWKSQVVNWVDGSTFSRPAISVSLDSRDRQYVMWHGFGNLAGIHFFSWNDTSWSDEIVHDDSWGSNPEVDPFMVLDSDDVPRMSFGQRGSPVDGKLDLRYASKFGPSWTFETADAGMLSPTDEVGWYSMIAFDSFGRPHIPYLEGSTVPNSGDLFYSHFNGFSWQAEVVDPGEVRGWSSIAIDHCNMPHIAYAEFSAGLGDGDLKHAWKSCPSAMPDLTITGNDISFSPPSPVENGTSVQINATIHNIGMTNVTNATVRFYNGAPHPARQIGGDQTIPFIRYGLSETTGITWTAQPEGTHDICIVVDPDYQIDELNELNNEACRPIDVVVPLPDLNVAQVDISFNQSAPFQNRSSVQIIATVHNVGHADASNVSVRFLDNPFGQIGGDERVASISVASSEILEKAWNATPVGSHEICVVADPEDQIMELVESNNEACVVVEVAEMSVPSPPVDLNAVLSGIEAVDVTLSWSLSLDDGAGFGNVVRYDIYRGTSWEGSGASYLLHASVSNGTSSFDDMAAGEGDPNDYFYRVCAASSANLSSCDAHQAGKFTRPLSPGPNLVSIPLIQSNESIDTFLQTVEYDRAWHYDSSSQKWRWHMTFKDYRRGLWNVNHTIGIWVNATEDSNLTVAGVVPARMTIHLYEGWNLVSFPSFNASYTVYDLGMDTAAVRVEGNDPTPPHHLRVLGNAEVLLAGCGYWVKVEADVSWTVDVG
jgi:hypothetical protein